MASGSFELTRTGSTSSYITFKCFWISKSNGSVSNTSTVTVTVTASKSSSSASNTWGSQSTAVSVGGTSQTASGSFTLAPGATITLLSKSYTVAHNDDGSKQVTISASVGGNVMYANGSETVTLDTIPRYATVGQSLNARTETTATINWSASATVDYIWYSTNNGSSWTGINVADGTSGSYNITGLSAGTTYQIKTRVRRKDSQLTSDSTTLSVSTYAYPYANSMPNFTIGDKLTIGIYNPLKRTVTVNIIGADGSQISNDRTTGTSITGYDNDTVQNRLYASIPNSKNGKYSVKVTFGTTVTSKNGGTYSVKTAECAPIIGNLTYLDTDAGVVSITGNNQTIVQRQSQVQATITGLAARKSASIARCYISVNGTTYNAAVNGSTAVSDIFHFYSSGNQRVIVYLRDSRGVETNASFTIKVQEWKAPSLIVTLIRHNNFYSDTDITADADYSSVGGKNAVTITYTAVKEGEVIPSISGTLTDNVTSTLTLDNNYNWKVAVHIVDSFGSRATYVNRVARGMPIIFFDRLKSSVGINCFPKEENSLEVNGVNLSKSIMTRSLGDDITDLTTDTYTVIPLNRYISSGLKLSMTNDGGIKIGKNVSKVLVSARMTVQSGAVSGNRHLRIISNSEENTLAWSYDFVDANKADDILITPILVNVQENDIIYAAYCVPIGTDKLGGNSYGGRTSLTVETVE